MKLRIVAGLPAWQAIGHLRSTMRFPGQLRVSVTNYLTGRAYKIVPACKVRCDSSNLARIVSICNEPDIYEWLFRGPLGGRPYEEANARQWLQKARDGWFSSSHFVFAVIDDQMAVVAACDIKTNEPIAEIGYWASRRHRGIMTNAVVALCTLAADAGFRGLFARTKTDNHRSQAVLMRAGFRRSAGENNGYERFELSFDAKDKIANQSVDRLPGESGGR